MEAEYRASHHASLRTANNVMSFASLIPSVKASRMSPGSSCACSTVKHMSGNVPTAGPAGFR
jgi:hypothetical protein